MIYKIFGKTISINSENKEIEEIIIDELSLYPLSNDMIDVEVNFVNKLNLMNKYSSNPAIHSSYKNGFVAIYGNNKILYSKDDILKIDIEVYSSDSRFKNRLLKFMNIGFKNNIEDAGAILHELVLVPMNYFFMDRALIHSSSMKNKKTGKIILFGGTGGVGKTSLELLLCRELGYSFISDDIAVMDKNANIYPNLASPKIYAYNIEGNLELEKLLFEDRSYYDKFQWNTVKSLKGLNRVRRNIFPNKIYKSIEKDKGMISEYYILSRYSGNAIEIEEVDLNVAAMMTLKIMQNEYHAFNQHIVWHEYNAMLTKTTPILVMEDIYDNWLQIYQKAFLNTKCFNIKIPTSLDQKEFLRIFKEKFSND